MNDFLKLINAYLHITTHSPPAVQEVNRMMLCNDITSIEMTLSVIDTEKLLRINHASKPSKLTKTEFTKGWFFEIKPVNNPAEIVRMNLYSE